MDLIKEDLVEKFIEDYESELETYFVNNEAEGLIKDQLEDGFNNWIEQVDPILLPGMVMRQVLENFKHEVSILKANLTDLANLGEHVAKKIEKEIENK